MKPTAAQQWVANSLEALALGAVVTAAINIYTAFSAGNLSLSQGLVIAITAVGAVLSKGLASLLTNPQTIQAGQDTINELRDATIALVNSHQNLLATFTAFLQQQAASQPASALPQPIVLNNPIPNQGTVPVVSPVFAQPAQQPLYMPNPSATATAAPPLYVQPYNPPSPDLHWGDTGLVPIITKP